MFDEMTISGLPRQPYAKIAEWLHNFRPQDVENLSARASAYFKQIGITFAVYGDKPDPERLIPFDPIPRVLTAKEWHQIERGCLQRARALNAFLADIYGDGEVLKAGIVPKSLVLENEAYEPQMQGFRPAKDIWAHIIGVDLVRAGEGEFQVLEDNCRTPSGVSYVLENRAVMAKILPQLFEQNKVREVDHYPAILNAALNYVAPDSAPTQAPGCAVLTPGRFNSAYYEHSFLADRMGMDLVTGQDLFVSDEDKVYKRTIAGPEQVHVIYRRIDDAFLDPDAFRKDSMLGVPGLMRAYKAGNVTITNAPGTGVADDKALYRFVPQIIRFYLGEEPILPNVKTWRCSEPDELAEVLDNLSELVVKEVHGSGGYGMLIGPKSTRQEIEDYRKRLLADPAAFVAQPTLDLSTVPTFTKEGLVEGRHVDLRPFVIMGERPQVIPGGLTRVAMKKGSLVVNSSQEGGVKDTWVLAE